MDYFLLIVAILLILAGLIGCIMPVLPGPPLSFVGLLFLHFTRWANYSSNMLLILGLLAIAVTVLDYIVPVWGTKKFGGSKAGVWGAAIGLLIGLFFGPAGIIIGPFLGAFVGEIIAKKESKDALKAAFGSFIGIMAGTVFKLICSGVITFYFFKELFT